jgi:hypothetical protein
MAFRLSRCLLESAAGVNASIARARTMLVGESVIGFRRLHSGRASGPVLVRGLIISRAWGPGIEAPEFI